MAQATVGQALWFINERHHGYHAFSCADGLVVRCEAVIRYAEDQDDNVIEELEVFPIVGGMVSMTAVKQWMGY